jgi:EEF1A lysine methyltransferase 4
LCFLSRNRIARSYGSSEYWEARYANREENFEWLLDWADMRVPLEALLSSSMRVLHIGCGNSTIGVNILADNLAAEVVNVDISPTVIEQMAVHHAEPGCLWEVQDVTGMSYTDSSFDAVLDKGTLDALLCKDTHDAKEAAAHALLSEAWRVLRDGGLYIVFSFGQPETRLPYLTKHADHFSVEHSIVRCGAKSVVTYCYVLRKAL